MDTIFALASAPGRAGVAVIRISGTGASSALTRLASSLPKPRQAALRTLKGADGTHLDEAIVIRFSDGHSFTGEEVVELHCHGSPAVIEAVLRELGGMPGIREAEPGEFTRRALDNDRLDIAQVEGLADLIDAETEAQRRQALRVLSGKLGKVAEDWRADLIRAAALVEATIDFADEDVPTDVWPEVRELIDRTLGSLRNEADGVVAAERVRAGFEVAIVGAPNVGKSTLLNAIAGRDAALTSEIAGTTRDVIEVRMDLRGLPVTVLDTAGIRVTEDVVEGLGVDRARGRAEAADLRVYLHCGEDLPDVPVQPEDIVLRSKVDMLPPGAEGVSGRTGAGVDALIERIASTLEGRTAGIGIATRMRHRVAMRSAIERLQAANEFLADGEASADLTAEELRASIRALDSLVGRIDVENILDEIFSSFCLGK